MVISGAADRLLQQDAKTVRGMVYIDAMVQHLLAVY